MQKTNIEWTNLQPTGFIHHLYNNNGKSSWFLWAIKQPTKNFKQGSGTYGCREMLIGHLENALTNGVVPAPTNLNRPALIYIRPLNATKAKKLGDTVSDVADSNVIQAVKTLNAIEKYKGWALSKIYKADSKIRNANVYVFDFSAKWTRTQQLLSLYTLIIRAGGMFKKGLKPEREKFFGKIEDWAIISPSTLPFVSAKDVNTMRKIWPFLFGFFKDMEVTFFSRSRDENFKLQSGLDGIDRLSSGVSTDRKASSWARAMKKYKE